MATKRPPTGVVVFGVAGVGVGTGVGEAVGTGVGVAVGVGIGVGVGVGGGVGSGEGEGVGSGVGVGVGVGITVGVGATVGVVVGVLVLAGVFSVVGVGAPVGVGADVDGAKLASLGSPVCRCSAVSWVSFSELQEPKDRHSKHIKKIINSLFIIYHVVSRSRDISRLQHMSRRSNPN